MTSHAILLLFHCKAVTKLISYHLFFRPQKDLVVHRFLHFRLKFTLTLVPKRSGNLTILKHKENAAQTSREATWFPTCNKVVDFGCALLFFGF